MHTFCIRFVKFYNFFINLIIKKYGQKKDSLLFVKGAYTPKDLASIRFIDYGTLASVESLTSLISSKFSLLRRQRHTSNESKSNESNIV